MNPTRTILIAAVGAAAGFAAATWFGGTAPSTGGAGEREVLYWVAPMDPNFRRDEPGKSPMGMDLVPVYADEQTAGGGSEPALRIDPVVVNNIGVKTAPVARGTLHRHIDTVGYVTPDADRVSHVHVRAEGWIETLRADTVGDAVSRDAALFEIYSPALASAQDEYLQALRAGHGKLAEAGERRLAALGMNAAQIRAVQSSGSTSQTITVTSPQDGYLLELNVREGMFVEPGNTIMSLADLSEIWVDVDVFEQQIDWVRVGQTARMRLPFAPDRVWQGTVDYVYPTIRPETRSARVRLAFDNPDLLLKPNMYAHVEIEADPRRDVLHVPSQAVIRSGDRARVILALGAGRFRPAEVATGLESEGRIEILRGLSADERVVVSSQFLIDSEASLDASLLRMLKAPEPAPEPGGMDAEPAAMDHDHTGMDHGDAAGMDHDHTGMAGDTP